jgi:hypothetical protein
MTPLHQHPMSLPQLLDISIPEREYFLPPIVPVLATTLAVSNQDISPLLLAALTAYTVAAKIQIRSLQTYGGNAAGRVAFLAPTRHARPVQAAFARLSKKGQPRGTTALATDDLEFSWLNPMDSDGLWLDTNDGRNRVEARIAERKLCIIYDLAACFKTRRSDTRFAYEIIEWFREQNRRGVTILAFHTESRKGSPWTRVQSDVNLLRLTAEHGPEDRDAIRITRRSDTRLAWDSLSLSFLYTSNGPLDFDFSPITGEQTLSHKQQKIRERRMQTLALLENKIDRKEIASRLGISVATLSRDIEAIYIERTLAEHHN